MNDIDALTLKLLTSKKKYNTYLETVEPDNGAKIREYCNAVKTNKDRIKVLLAKYLDDPETQITNELDDSVESCLKELLRHLEARDRESKSASYDYDEQDDDGPSFLCSPMRPHFAFCFRPPALSHACACWSNMLRLIQAGQKYQT